MADKEIIEIRISATPSELLRGVDIEKMVREYDYDENLQMQDEVISELVCDFVDADIVNHEAFSCFPQEEFVKNIKVFPEKARLDLEEMNFRFSDFDPSKKPTSEKNYTMAFLVPCELDIRGFLRDALGGEKELQELLEWANMWKGEEG